MTQKQNPAGAGAPDRANIVEQADAAQHIAVQRVTPARGDKHTGDVFAWLNQVNSYATLPGSALKVAPTPTSQPMSNAERQRRHRERRRNAEREATITAPVTGTD